MNIWRYFFLCICLLFSYTSIAASIEDQVNKKLTDSLNCKDRETENLCYLSLDKRGRDLIIFLSSSSYRMQKLNKENSALDAANLMHSVYKQMSVLIKRIDSDKANDLIIIMEVIFKNDRITVIHDINNTVFVDMDKRVDIYQRLKDYRKLTSHSPENKQKQQSLKKGERLTVKYTVTTTYNVLSSDAIKDKAGHIEVLSKPKKTGEKVQHTKITHSLIWFPISN